MLKRALATLSLGHDTGITLEGESLFSDSIPTKNNKGVPPRVVITLQVSLALYYIVFCLVSPVLMVHTRPIILHLVLMLITKGVTSPPVRFRSLVGQERIPIRVIKYVNLFVRLLIRLAVWPFLYSRDCSFVRLLVGSFTRSFGRSVGHSAVCFALA